MSNDEQEQSSSAPLQVESARHEKGQLPPQQRWAIFAAVVAVCVIVGIAAPLAWALTDEHSVMNPNHDPMVATTESADDVSSSNPSDSDLSGAEGAEAQEATYDPAASNSSSVAATTGTDQLSNDDYILPESATRLYTAEELSALSDYELYLARNEAFAKYGRKFKNADLVQYFSGKDWYVPTYEPADFDAMPSPLNDIERANIDLVRQIESQRNSPYAV